MIYKIALIGIIGIMSAINTACTTERLKYTVLEEDGHFELRQYKKYIVAEVEVKGELKEAGNNAFRPLFNYISGDNKMEVKLDAGEEVQQKESKKIAMTAPVNQEKSGDKWLVSFVMPEEYKMKDLPKPNDKNIKLREIPEKQVYAVRYSGGWSESSYKEHKEKLEDYIDSKNYKRIGEAIWARYNSPMTPKFMRRNEVLYEVKKIEKNEPSLMKKSELAERQEK